jgi:hypothetical protein
MPFARRVAESLGDQQAGERVISPASCCAFLTWVNTVPRGKCIMSVWRVWRLASKPASR